MAVRDDFAPGEVLAAADLNDTFASKLDYALPVNAQTGTTYTFVLADAEKLTTASNAAAVTLTIPPQSSVTWADQTILRLVNYGAGDVTVDGGSGVTVTNTATTIGQYESAVAIRTGSDAWTLVPFAGGGDPTVIEAVTGTGTTTVPAGFSLMDILLVGGGNAGSWSGRRGAGGAGGLVYQVADVAVSGGLSISVTIGGGGSPQGGAGSATTVTPSGGSTYSSASGTSAGAGNVRGISPTGIFAGPAYAGGGGTGGFDGDGGTIACGVGGGPGLYYLSSPAGTRVTGRAGWPNTGGGGGGGAFNTASGYAGGSGLVVLAYHN